MILYDSTPARGIDGIQVWKYPDENYIVIGYPFKWMRCIDDYDPRLLEEISKGGDWILTLNRGAKILTKTECRSKRRKYEVNLEQIDDNGGVIQKFFVGFTDKEYSVES